MKPLSTIGKLAVLVLLATDLARAEPILDVSGALTLLDPTQLERLSRNDVPQDWAGSEPFPGLILINTAIAYHYHVYPVNVGVTSFIQVSFDSESPNTFASAYDTSYAPNSAGPPNLGFNTNWLGDAGFSENPFPGDPLFFQVIVPQNHNLLIVVNNTAAANVGVGDPFSVLVEGFIDSEFTDPPAAVPEPATVVLMSSGFVLLALARRFRQSSRRSSTDTRG